ncbi:hypothetical protein FQN49_005696 [Arthroderma sp. PD_2]|nr:hypothetical protein FQN49_005696 [Arthroderma sp. PD_2]
MAAGAAAIAIGELFIIRNRQRLEYRHQRRQRRLQRLQRLHGHRPKHSLNSQKAVSRISSSNASLDEDTASPGVKVDLIRPPASDSGYDPDTSCSDTEADMVASHLEYKKRWGTRSVPDILGVSRQVAGGSVKGKKHLWEQAFIGFRLLGQNLTLDV